MSKVPFDRHISEGNTFEEALANIKEATTLYIEDMTTEELAASKQNAVLAPIEVSVSMATA